NIHQGKSEKRETWNDALLKTREKTIQPIGFFASFTHHDFITCHNILIFGFQKAFLKKQPLERSPRKNSMIKALDGSIASTFLCPAREAQHRYSSAGDQHPKDDLAHLPQSRFLD